MATAARLARRLGCSGAPLGLGVVLVALAASPGFVDAFTSIKWYALEAVAAGWLLLEVLVCRSGGLPRFVQRAWIGWALLSASVVLGSLRHGPAWATAPLVSRASFVALVLSSYWMFRRSALELFPLRGPLAASAAAVVTLGLVQMAGLRPMPWLAGGDQRSATFGNVNMAAQFVGLALVVLWPGVPSLTKAAHRRLAELLAGGSLAYVFLAGTRSVAVALVVALAVLALVRRLAGPFLARSVALAAALVLLLLRAGAGPPGPAAQASKASSARLRLAVWSDTLDLVRHHPLGVGASNFEHVFIPYALSGRSRPGEHLVFRSPHNDYLRLLAEEGVVGGTLLLGLGLLFVLRELRLSPATSGWRSDPGATIASGGTFLVVEAFFQFPFEMAFPALVAAVLLGLAFAAADLSAGPSPGRPSPAWRWGVLSVALAVAILAGVVRLAAAEVLSATRRNERWAVGLACSLDPRRLEACVQAAWLQSRAGEHASARKLLGDVLSRSPAYFPAIKLLAEDLLSTGDREEGCRYVRAYDALLGEASSLRLRFRETCPRPDLESGAGTP